MTWCRYGKFSDAVRLKAYRSGLLALALLALALQVVTGATGARAEEKPELLVQIGHRGGPTSMAFSPDGRLLASVGAGDKIKLWDTGTGDLVRTVSTPGEIGPEGWHFGNRAYRVVTKVGGALSFLPDGRLLECTPPEADLIDLRNGSARRLLFPAGPQGECAVAASTDGSLAAVLGSQITLWNTQTGQAIRTCDDSSPAPYGIKWVTISSDGRIVAGTCEPRRAGTSYSDAGGLRFWDASTGKVIRTIAMGKELFAFGPDGSPLISVDDSTTYTVEQLDLGTGTTRILMRGPGTINQAAFLPDGTLLVAPAYGSVAIHNARDGSLVRTFAGSRGPFACSANGGVLATASEGATIQLWNSHTGELIRTLAPGPEPVGKTVFSPDGRTIVYECAADSLKGYYAAGSETLRQWDLAAAAPVRTIDLVGSAFDLCVLPGKPPRLGCEINSFDGAILTNEVWWWNLESGVLLGTVTVPGTVVGYSQDWTRTPVQERNGSIRLRDLKSLTPSQPIAQPVAPPIKSPGSAFDISMVLMPDGATALTGAGERPVWWDLKTGKQKPLPPVVSGSQWNGLFVPGHPLGVDSHRGYYSLVDGVAGFIAFSLTSAPTWSADGKLLAALLYDRVLLLDPAAGKIISSISLPRSVFPVGLSADGLTAAVVGSEGVEIWDLAAGRIRATLIMVSSEDSKSGPWLAYTPDGYYDGSAGCESLLHWKLGGRLLTADELRTTYHRPDLVRKALGTGG